MTVTLDVPQYTTWIFPFLVIIGIVLLIKFVISFFT